MTFNKQLFTNVLWRGVYYLTIFMLNIVIARSYEAAQSGWINYISNNFAFVLLFGSMSFDVAILYFGAAQKISIRKLTSFALLWSVLVSILFAITVHMYIDKNAMIQSKGLLKFAAINYFVGIIITNFFFNLFIIKEQILIPNVLLAAINVILICLVPNTFLYCTWFDGETYLYFYYLAFSLQGIVLVIAYLIQQGNIVMKLPNRQELLQLCKYAGVAFAGNLIFFLVYRVDYWLLNYYQHNALALGNYIQASKLGQMLLIFSMVVSSTVFPQTASGQVEVVIHKLLTIIRNFIMLFILLFIVLLVLGSGSMTWVFGPSFYLMYKPLLYLLPGILCLNILSILSAYFGGINRTMVNVKGALLGLIVIIVLDVIYIKHYGIIAAAIISSIGYAVAMLYAIICFHKLHAIKWQQLLVVRISDFKWIPNLIKNIR